jgi:hypothetical protein
VDRVDSTLRAFLSDRYGQIDNPDVQVMAPALLARYRSPFDSRPGSELPAMWGGFVISKLRNRVRKMPDRTAPCLCTTGVRPSIGSGANGLLSSGRHWWRPDIRLWRP